MQSIITRVLPYLDLNASGICQSTFSLENLVSMLPRTMYRKLTHVTSFLLTVALEQLKRITNSCSERFYLILHKSMKNVSINNIHLRLPLCE